jgi:SAM-dependent methyltransferase
MTTRRTIDEIYGPGVEVDAAVEGFLDESLAPRSPGMLLDMVGELGLSPGSIGLDVGCRTGGHAIELARRFGLRIIGVDPVGRHIDEGRTAIAMLADEEPEFAGRIQLLVGTAEALPLGDGTVDLIWCRDVLLHVKLDEALREAARVLRPGGVMLAFVVCATTWLEPAEADRIWAPLAALPENADPARLERGFENAGLSIVERIELTSDWRESLEESNHEWASRQLLHIARLLRGRDHFIERFGEVDFDIELANSLYGVYQVLGKLNPTIYSLRRA